MHRVMSSGLISTSGAIFLPMMFFSLEQTKDRNISGTCVSCLPVRAHVWSGEESINAILTLFPPPSSSSKSIFSRKLTNTLSYMNVASGDLRNVVKTIAQLPNNYCQSVDVVVNDRDIDIMARNVLLLLIALVVDNVDEAVDCMVHVWYSAFIRKLSFKPVNLTHLFGIAPVSLCASPSETFSTAPKRARTTGTSW